MVKRVAHLLSEVLHQGEEIWYSGLLQLRGVAPSKTKLANCWYCVRELVWPWASAGLNSKRTLKKKLWPNQRLSRQEQFRRILHSVGDLRSSIWLFVALLFVQLLTAMLLANPQLANGSDVTGSSLLTIAEILGGVIGIVIAVTIFGAQFHGELEGELAFLVPLFTKRIGLLPISSLFFSVISANMLGGLWLAVSFPGSATVLGLLNCISVLVLVLAVIWLISESVSSIGRDLLHVAYLPGLETCLERTAIIKAQAGERDHAISKILVAAGIRSDPEQCYFERTRNELQTISKSLAAPIIDINLNAVQRLILASKELIDSKPFVVGLNCGSKEICICTQNASRDGSLEFAEGLANAAITADALKDENELFQRLDMHLASNDCATSSRQYLECITLVDWCISVNSRYAGMLGFDFDIYRYLSALVANAWYSTDTNRLDSLFSWACRLLATSNAESSFYGSLLIQALYLRHAKSPDRYARFEEKLDGFLGVLFSESRAVFDNLRMQRDYEYDLHKMRIRLGLFLIKVSIEFERAAFLANILGRVFCDARFQFERQHRNVAASYMDRIADLNAAAAFCVVGWSVHLVRHGSLTFKDLLTTLEWARSYFRDQSQCLDLWRRIHRHEVYGAEFYLAELACQSWHPEASQRRSGIVYGVPHALYWFQDGFFTIGLTLPFSELDLQRLESGRLQCMDLSSINLEGTLSWLADAGWFTSEQLSLDENQQDLREDAFLRLIAKSNSVFRKQQCLAFIDTSFNTARLQDFKAHVVESVQALKNLLATNSFQNSALGTSNSRLSASLQIPRQLLIDDGTPFSNLTPLCELATNHALVNWIAISLANRTASTTAMRANELFESLRERLLEAVTERVTIVLCEETHSQILDHEGLLELIGGDKIDVLISPCCASQKIFIVSLKECFAQCHQGFPPVMEIVDLDEDRKEQWRTTLTHSKDGTFRTSDIQVEVIVTFAGPLIERPGPIYCIQLLENP